MPTDKSLFFYGSLYHRLMDPPLADVRRAAVDLVPKGSSVLDVACGITAQFGHAGSVVSRLRCAHDCREAVVIQRGAGQGAPSRDEP